MTTPNASPPAGGTTNPGGEGGSGGSGDGGGNAPGPVPYETHQQLLKEKKQAAARAAELETELAALRTKDLEAQGDFKKLLEQERERSKTLETKLTETDQRETARRKLAGVLSAMQGTIESKYFNLIPYADVIVDPTTGDLDQMSVAKVVEQVRKSYPEIIKTSGGPTLPSAAPQGGNPAQPGTIKRSAWELLPTADMRKWKPDQVVAD